MKNKILIVDDEVMMTDLLSDFLSDRGYRTETANSSAEALELLPHKPDLIILDVNMPDMDGLELCQIIREHVSCPIVFVTARITEQDKIIGLQYGGDDYITKPFSLEELLARIAAHLRRDERPYASHSLLTSGELLVNLSQRRIFYRDVEIKFSKKEFDLIEFFLTNPGQVFDREKIYERVWGWDTNGVIEKGLAQSVCVPLFYAIGLIDSRNRSVFFFSYYLGLPFIPALAAAG